VKHRTGCYRTGEAVEPGDVVEYLGEKCTVEFSIFEPVEGDEAMNWFLTEFPGGGVMLESPSCGRVFIGQDALRSETVRLVERRARDA